MSQFDPNKPFILKKLPPTGINFETPRITKLLIQARTEIGELKGYSEGLPNPLLLLSPAIIKDALESSEIENIVTTMIDVLQNQVIDETEQKAADKEVLRYREGILYGYDQILKGMPITGRMIRGIQKRLMTRYDAGDYRKSQNHLHNHRTKEVIYTPPAANTIEKNIKDLEDFINGEDDIDPLIKAALMHYQFEAIHPFGDGNGRTGRILMVLYLIQEGLLSYPIIFISGFINNHRADYYKLLLEVSTKENWEEFIIYILEGFNEQAATTKAVLFSIKEAFFRFKKEMKTKLPKIYTTDLIEQLFAFPVITPVKLGKELGIHYTTASKYLRLMKEAGLLKDAKVGKYHMYINQDLVSILWKKS
jgi:Fic family protein